MLSVMEVAFADDDLDRLETDPTFDMGLAEGVVKAFRKRMQMIRSARDERDFYAMKSLHFEKLKGKRQHEHSMRLNEQYRLLLSIEPSGEGKRIRILGIEDYH
jgi:proteic killer suppression protein